MNIDKKALKNFGFGLMRLPMISKTEVDIEQVKKMADLFIESGFNYFDTAHGYLNGLSELAFKEAVAKRYERDKYVLTNKLSSWLVNSEEDIEKVFNDQLDACGVEYFDFYLMHSQHRNSYPKMVELHAYDFIRKMKKEGKIKHFGISFHDKAEYLDKILTEQPDIEIVQIQFNYLDFESDEVESRKVYEVLRKHNKPVIVMEPVRGGALSNLEKEYNEIIDLENYTASSYALRFAASFDGIEMVLSGMSDINQMEDNIKTFKDFKPLDDELKNKLLSIGESIKKQRKIPCTKCEYCMSVCPKGIKIPEIFDILNEFRVYKSWGSHEKYKKLVETNTKASECLKCGKCEKNCPQHLNIRELLKEAKNAFEGE